jgi:hypothetical protein
MPQDSAVFLPQVAKVPHRLKALTQGLRLLEAWKMTPDALHKASSPVPGTERMSVGSHQWYGSHRWLVDPFS